MSIVEFFSAPKVWRTERFEAPWAPNRPSLHDFIVAQLATSPSATLPDDTRFQSTDGLKFAPGAMDGTGMWSAGAGETPAPGLAIHALIRKVLRKPDRVNLDALFQAISEQDALRYVDPLLGHLSDDPKVHGGRLRSLMRWLAREAPDRNAVKCAIAILGLFQGDGDATLFRTLGQHDEFTLFAITAFKNSRPSSEAEEEIFQLARTVKGWGRIHCVEALEQTEREDIKHWLLRDGFRNTIMNEYLALTAAQTGELCAALRRPEPDAALLDGASDILIALYYGGPAPGIESYADALATIRLWLAHLQTRPPTLSRLTAAALMTDHLQTSTQTSPLYPEDETTAALTQAQAYLSETNNLRAVEDALNSDNVTTFAAGAQTARLMGLPVWDALFKRQQDRPEEEHWYHLMRTEDAKRVAKTVALACAQLPLDFIATGASNSLGLGREFKAHAALDFIVQDLDKHPGLGTRLLQVCLQSPVVRNRNMACKALESWPVDQWAPDLVIAVQAAVEVEPRDDVRERLARLRDKAASAA